MSVIFTLMKFLPIILLLIGYISLAQNPTNPWNAKPLEDAPTTFTNPVIPGFYSDPSVCRVGDDYYLITSTFEFFPGVPVFHSKDLVNWEQIGHCIHRPEQIPENLNIFAATIRHHDGTFYMITTNIDKGNFYVTATDPAGPWSDPFWIDVEGIDPDLYFEDGRAYVITSTFELTEVDLATGKLIGEKRRVWNGTGGRYSEGPHIYKKDGYYYLMASEGGTEEAHVVTIARSDKLWGPYTDNPANPILAHANAAGQNKVMRGVGHADMVQAHDESWWMVFHGYRDVVGYPYHHIIGRETCLVPVSWPVGGWPVVNGNGTVDIEMKSPTLPLKPFPEKPARTDFTEELGMEWNYVQPPLTDNYELDTKKGSLSLTGSASRIGNVWNLEQEGIPTFVGRRLTDIDFTATTSIDFNPENENEEAGMILVNNGSAFEIMVKKEGNQRVVLVKLQFGPNTYRSERYPLEDGPVELRISGEMNNWEFAFSQNGKAYQTVDTADARYLSTETVGWFTGVYVGLYATGNGKPSESAATYNWFDYEAK